MPTVDSKSKYHPERPCSECVLCGKYSMYYSHYGAWSEGEREYLKQHLSTELAASACICAAHQREARREHSPGFMPKWKKPAGPSLAEHPTHCCAYPSCTTNSRLIAPSFASPQQLCVVLQVPSRPELLLCSKHYMELYRQFHSPLQCASCGVEPKSGITFTRHCPDPTIINEAMNTNITEEDRVCFRCYKRQLATN